MEYTEEEYLMISGIQHFKFCRRQWALIHIEQQWEENVHTVVGELMHKKAHDPYLKEKIEWGMVPYVQAMLLARYLRGDLDSYPVFLWK